MLKNTDNDVNRPLQNTHQIELPSIDDSNLSEIPRVSMLEQAFPFEFLSGIAQKESWRKEVYRPIYHLHKWWAQRLGSVFRGLIIGAISQPDDDFCTLFYSDKISKNITVYDPFMGSGTTVGEAAKLGLVPIGRDINPVAYFNVISSLSAVDRQQLINDFKKIEKTAGKKITQLYESKDDSGEKCTVLYYFWVKELSCPSCDKSNLLFSNYIFARHAYAKKYPKARCVCPSCFDVIETVYNATDVKCGSCANSFNPQNGIAKGQNATCVSCNHTFSISKTARGKKHPPKHRMYAKLVLKSDGSKTYLPVTKFDIDKYNEAEETLKTIPNPFPLEKIAEGYNTRQAMNYGYHYWHQFFNPRQIVAINLLAHEISKIDDDGSRNLLYCLLSGTLEFNNMFASYKGEGTGAVRHMFSHHILKPERTPLEANLWGTPKSSGSFSTLFKSRILRALDYKENPFEIKDGEKFQINSSGLNRILTKNYENFTKIKNSVYISCGDSSHTDIKSCSVDLVLTDPPFFDNVNYSELADFFYVWQKHFGLHPSFKESTTRSKNEVQHRDPDTFSERLESVFAESCRVLKPDGILAFSYHHSRDEGWTSVAKAVWGAELQFTAAFPIKAEMSVATPKSAAKNPIDFDIILVCRKSSYKYPGQSIRSFDDAINKTREQISQLQGKYKLSINDRKIFLIGQLIVAASNSTNIGTREVLFKKYCERLNEALAMLNS